MTEEVARLEAANAKLARELGEMRKEMTQIRVQAQKSIPTPGPTSVPAVEEIVRIVMDQCGTMVNARFAGLEDRLLPEVRLRPPLAADKKKKSVAAASYATTVRAPPPNPEAVASNSGAAKAPKEQNNKKKETNEPRPPGPAPESTEEGWSKVTRKGAKTSAKVAKATKAAQTAKPAAKPAKAPAKRQRMPKAPRSAAVILTLQPDAVKKGITYAKILSDAKESVDLKALGIEGVRFRTAATGARVLELPGAASAEKADSLANKLRESFSGDLLKVSRPQKMAELRLSGLDDCTTKEDISVAVAKVGGCSVESLKVGNIVRPPGRQGTVWLSCPVAAAKKAAAGRILVGWTSVSVKVLEPRPLQCYRCLEIGHLGAKCQCTADRSALCFRCGKSGHKAATCEDKPHCPVCEAAGKNADHRVGAKACKGPDSNKGKERKTASVGPSAPSQPSTRPRAQPEDRMDTS